MPHALATGNVCGGRDRARRCGDRLLKRAQRGHGGGGNRRHRWRADLADDLSERHTVTPEPLAEGSDAVPDATLGAIMGLLLALASLLSCCRSSLPICSRSLSSAGLV